MDLEKQIRKMEKRGELTPIKENISNEIWNSVEKEMKEYKIENNRKHYISEIELNKIYLTN